MRLKVWMAMAAIAIALATIGCGDDGGNAASPAPGPDDQGTAGMGPASNTSSGSDPSSGATETNAVPAPCESNDMCPSGVQCVFPSGGGTLGFCDVSDTSGEPNDGSGSGASDGSDPSSASSGGASLATPAACNSDSDCPEGVACMKFDPAGPGFCDVNEMQAP